jgi:hypothetical protein
MLIVFLHLAFFMIAQSQGELIQSSYVVILGSLLFFVTSIYGFNRSRLVCCALILLLVKPVEFFVDYKIDAQRVPYQMFTDHVVPKFEFQRPQDSRSHGRVFRFRDFDFESNLTMNDSDGRFLSYPDSASFWHFLLMTDKDYAVYLAYIKNKFYLYDSVRFYNFKDLLILKEIKKGLTHDAERAYAFDGSLPHGEFRDLELGRVVHPRIPVFEGTGNFEVRRFTVNEISIDYHLEVSKFLVYTDSFTSDWQGLIDGKKNIIYRSNGAAKGMILPAGKHTVQMIYRPFPGEAMNWFCVIFLAGYLLLLVWALFKENADAGRFKAREALNSGLASLESEGYGTLLKTSAFFYVYIIVLSYIVIDTGTLHELRRRHLLGCIAATYDVAKAKMVYFDHLRRAPNE